MENTEEAAISQKMNANHYRCMCCNKTGCQSGHPKNTHFVSCVWCKRDTCLECDERTKAGKFVLGIPHTRKHEKDNFVREEEGIFYCCKRCLRSYKKTRCIGCRQYVSLEYPQVIMIFKTGDTVNASLAHAECVEEDLGKPQRDWFGAVFQCQLCAGRPRRVRRCRYCKTYFSLGCSFKHATKCTNCGLFICGRCRDDVPVYIKWKKPSGCRCRNTHNPLQNKVRDGSICNICVGGTPMICGYCGIALDRNNGIHFIWHERGHLACDAEGVFICNWCASKSCAECVELIEVGQGKKHGETGVAQDPGTERKGEGNTE